MAVNDDELEPVAEDDDDLEDELDEGEDEDTLPASEDEEEGEESSLEELLAQRAAARRGTDDAEDEDEIFDLAPDTEVTLPVEPIARVVPIKDRQEFVCRRCFLVKARTQLADADRLLCRDCV